MAIGFGMVVLIAKQSRPSFAGNEDGRAAVASTIGVKGPPLSLDELLSQSDFLSVHVPLTSDTRGLIGEQELVKMKPSAVVINAARGEVVDEQGMINKYLAQSKLSYFAQTIPSRVYPSR